MPVLFRKKVLWVEGDIYISFPSRRDYLSVEYRFCAAALGMNIQYLHILVRNAGAFETHRHRAGIIAYGVHVYDRTFELQYAGCAFRPECPSGKKSCCHQEKGRDG